MKKQNEKNEDGNEVDDDEVDDKFQNCPKTSKKSIDFGI